MYNMLLNDGVKQMMGKRVIAENTRVERPHTNRSYRTERSRPIGKREIPKNMKRRRNGKKREPLKTAEEMDKEMEEFMKTEVTSK